MKSGKGSARRRELGVFVLAYWHVRVEVFYVSSCSVAYGVGFRFSGVQWFRIISYGAYGLALVHVRHYLCSNGFLMVLFNWLTDRRMWGLLGVMTAWLVLTRTLDGRVIVRLWL